MSFSNKKILFICPKFHGYETMIINKLESFGASVTYYPERSYKADFSIINNFYPSKMDKFQERHYNKILKDTKDNAFDYLFVIRGYKLSKVFLEGFRRQNPSAKTIMYQWDSDRTNHFSHLVSQFDKVSSFDFEDCENLKLEYIPLFYTDDVLEYVNNKKIYKYDFFFMGFFFEERYDAVLKFREFCNRNGYSLKAFLYMPFQTRIKYYFKRKNIDLDIVSFKPMPRKEYLTTLSESNIMVDVSNPGQTGLAMRVIESLACKTKILTNNHDFVKDQDVANSGMVAQFSISDINVDEDFFNLPANKVSNVVLPLSDWLGKIFKDYEA